MPNGNGQFDGINPVDGYTLFHGNDGTSFYLKGANLSDSDVTQRVATLRGSSPTQNLVTGQGMGAGNATDPTNALNKYLQSPEGIMATGGPQDPRAAEASKAFRQGNYARGTHLALANTAELLAPAAAPFAVASPLAFGTSLVGGAAGGTLARTGAEAFGANEDQADIAGDIGGLAGGFFGGMGGSKLSNVTAQSGGPKGLLARILRDPDSGKITVSPTSVLNRIVPNRADVNPEGWSVNLPGGMPKPAPVVDPAAAAVKARIASWLPTRMPKTAATPEIAPAGAGAPTVGDPQFSGSEGRAATWTNQDVMRIYNEGDVTAKRAAIQQMISRGMPLPENARYVMGSPDYPRAVYNPRETTTFEPDNTPIRNLQKNPISSKRRIAPAE